MAKKRLQVFKRNLKESIKTAYLSDKRVFALFFILDTFSGITPVIIGYLTKLVIDSITTTQSTFQIVTISSISLLAFRYTLDLIDDLRRYGTNYFDRIFRYKMEYSMVNTFTERMSKLDIGYFENPDIQNLIFRAARSYPGRIMNLVLYSSYFFWVNCNVYFSQLGDNTIWLVDTHGHFGLLYNKDYRQR